MPIAGTYIDVPFATAGTTTPVVPDAIQPSGAVSFEQGYGADYLLAYGNPAALFPQNNEFNYLFNLITTILQTHQQQTVAPWITHAENGGSAFPYNQYALVLYTDGHIYESLINSNTTDPVNDGINWAIVDLSGMRIKLATNTNYYVATTGNDSTGNGSSGSPWLTIQHALNYVSNNLDLSGYTVTINVADGTYAAVSISNPFVGDGTVILSGDVTTPANCFISSSSSSCIAVVNKATLTVRGFKVSTSNGSGLSADLGGSITVMGAMEFGACSNAHVYSGRLSDIEFVGSTPYKISGAAANHIQCASNSHVEVNSQTITISGTLNFSGGFVLLYYCAVLECSSCTYTGGTITGTRYIVSTNSVINTSGGGPTYFPGNSAGVATSGGQYE